MRCDYPDCTATAVEEGLCRKHHRALIAECISLGEHQQVAARRG